ncbi:hypothetical protein H4Q26_006356 [Puccinia striiformis f. sp. tritici PST-130]|nr:hypothetical protein H4Q26_006356 [Puccinia striiformis f. sp. tritici PST-130]
MPSVVYSSTEVVLENLLEADWPPPTVQPFRLFARQPAYKLHSSSSKRDFPSSPGKQVFSTSSNSKQSIRLKMHLSSLLQILVVILIQGGVTHVQSWGCEKAGNDYRSAGCIYILPDLNPPSFGQKPRPWHLKLMISPWDNVKKTYSCDTAPQGFKTQACCTSDKVLHDGTTTGIFVGICKKLDGTEFKF